MTPPRRPAGPRGRKAVDEIERRLTDLFGPLTGRAGAAVDGLRNVVDRLERDADTRGDGETVGPGVEAGTDLGGRDLASGPAPQARRPSLTIREANGVWTVEAEVPGVARPDLSLSASGRTLTVEASGRRRYAFSAEAPRPVTVDEIEIALEHGLLTLSLPFDRTGRRP